MPIDITKLTTHLGKRKASHSELFTLGLFYGKINLPPEHKDAKTHHEVW